MLYYLAVKNSMTEVQCFYNSSSRTESITLRFNSSDQQLKYTDLRMDVKNFHPWIYFPKCKKQQLWTVLSAFYRLIHKELNVSLECKSQDHTMLSTAMHKAIRYISIFETMFPGILLHQILEYLWKLTIAVLSFVQSSFPTNSEHFFFKKTISHCM